MVAKAELALAPKMLVRTGPAFFASAGLALAFASGLAVLACYLGMLFSGSGAFFGVLITTAVCAFSTLLTALLFKHTGKHFGWHTIFIEVFLLALVCVALLSWFDTRQHLKNFMSPVPVPNGVRVIRGRSIMFCSYVHFTAPPAVIASLLQSKGLTEVSAEVPDKPDITGFSSREQTKVSWGWWQPATMSNPKFFFRHHTSEAVQGWSEGWWVNGATNEVYAFIGG